MFTDTDLDNMIEAHPGAKTITVKLGGATVKTIRGIHKRRTEFVSPHNAEMAVVLPSLQCKESDLEGVTREYAFEVSGTDYKMYKEPDVRDSGFALIGLTKA